MNSTTFNVLIIMIFLSVMLIVYLTPVIASLQLKEKRKGGEK